VASSGNMDPFEMWRQMLGRLETSINSMANESMSGEQFNRTLGQFSEVSTGMRQAFDKALERYFKAMRVPSRTDIAALADRLERIEDKLDSLAVAMSDRSAEGRPTRTRRPPADAEDGGNAARDKAPAAKAQPAGGGN